MNLDDFALALTVEATWSATVDYGAKWDNSKIPFWADWLKVLCELTNIEVWNIAN